MIRINLRHCRRAHKDAQLRMDWRKRIREASREDFQNEVTTELIITTSDG